jgi:hypothetical protein
LSIPGPISPMRARMSSATANDCLQGRPKFILSFFLSKRS